MAGQLNPYFNFYTQTNEQNLYTDLVDEIITIAGTETLFIPKEMTAVDDILGEPYQVLHNRYFPIPCVIGNPQGYGDNMASMSQFGLRWLVTSDWIMSKRMFDNLKIEGREIRPYEGDLLLIGPDPASWRDPIFTHSIFEIMYVSTVSPFWPLGKWYVYTLQCQLYVSSPSEKFETGNPEIDFVNKQDGAVENLDISSNIALKKKKPTLIDFTESNPFGDL